MISFTFFLALIFSLFFSAFLPNFVILGFSPWIALTCLSFDQRRAFLAALVCGVIMDLISDDPFGVHAINYTLVCLVIYRYRNFFSFDNPIHLSVYTYCISSLSTIFQLLLLFLFDRRIPFTEECLLGDVFIMPFADAVYALLWFVIPIKLVTEGKVWLIRIKQRFFLTSR